MHIYYQKSFMILWFDMLISYITPALLDPLKIQQDFIVEIRLSCRKCDGGIFARPITATRSTTCSEDDGGTSIDEGLDGGARIWGATLRQSWGEEEEREGEIHKSAWGVHDLSLWI